MSLPYPSAQPRDNHCWHFRADYSRSLSGHFCTYMQIIAVHLCWPCFYIKHTESTRLSFSPPGSFHVVLGTELAPSFMADYLPQLITCPSSAVSVSTRRCVFPPCVLFQGRGQRRGFFLEQDGGITGEEAKCLPGLGLTQPISSIFTPSSICSLQGKRLPLNQIL